MSPDKGASWVQTAAPSQIWTSLAASSDATKLYAAVGYSRTPSGLISASGPIYASNDGGTTWKPSSAPKLSWQSIASSGDGVRLVAVSWFAGYIYVSFDAGATWVNTHAPPQLWSSVASSDDGRRLVAVSFSSLARLYGEPAEAGGIYTLHLPFRVPPSPVQTPRATQAQLQN